MPTTDAHRLLLFADARRAVAPPRADKPIRRYRLARLESEAGRRALDEPRYAYLKRSYD